MERWRVKLPPGCEKPFDVYVNGVLQQEGDDYEIAGRVLLFNRPLAKDKISAGRWLLGAFGVGTYRKNDEVDVRYEAGGRQLVAHALDIQGPAES
jgi:hypothetical protein